MFITNLVKNIKRVIFIWLLGFTFFWLSSNIQYTHAQSTWETQQVTANNTLEELSVTLDVILNFLYVILWPMLAITGMALDNSLVYGSVFHLDQILRQIWTVVMYLSFVFLWGMIIWDIAKAGIWWWDVQAVVKKWVPRWILVGILIPLSWFLMWTVIDLSTIAIYQVWNIPLNIIGNNSWLDRKLLQIHSTIDFNSSIKASQEGGFRYNTYYSCQGENFIPCRIDNYRITQSGQNSYITQFISWANMQPWSISTEYCVMTPTQLYKLDYQWWGSLSITWEQLKQWLQGGTEKMASCNSVKNIIQRSQTMVWPLYTIYWSLLNFASINHTDWSKSVEADAVIFLIKTVVGLLLIIPLIWLAVMAVWRVGMLWLAIAFSPLIIMFRVFDNNKTLSWAQKGMNFKRWIDAKFNINNIIKLIFQPVLTVFALGLSLILLTATTSMLSPDTNSNNTTSTNQLLQSFGMETRFDDKNNTQCLDIDGYTNTCVTDFPNKFSSTVFADYFSWIIANIIGILIMRNLLFASMKWNEITDNMVWAVEKVWNNFLKNNIPVFGGYSYESVFGNEGISRVYEDVMNKFTEDKTKGRAQVVKKRLENATDGTFAKMDEGIALTEPKDENGNVTTDQKIVVPSASRDFATKVWALDKDKSVFIAENDLSKLKDYRTIGWYTWSNLAEYLGDKKFWDFMNTSEEWNKLLYRLLSMDKKEISRWVWEKNVDTFINNRSNKSNMLWLINGVKDWQTVAASISPNMKKDWFILYWADVKNVEWKDVYENINTLYVKQDSVSSINEFIKNYPHMWNDTKKYYSDQSKYTIDEDNKQIKLIQNTTNETNTNTTNGNNQNTQNTTTSQGNNTQNSTQGDDVISDDQ